MYYETLLWIGALGTFAQFFLGGHGRLGRVGRGGRGKAGRATRGKAGRRGSDSGGFFELLMGLFSPLTFFSLCLGGGATGMLVRPLHLSPIVVALLALLGGFLLYFLVVQPLLSVAMHFASDPAKNLGGTLGTKATAESAFDASGRGIVRLIVDGQVRRVLATLEDGEGRHVAAGESLLVVLIDGKKNTCRVRKEN